MKQKEKKRKEKPKTNRSFEYSGGQGKKLF